MKESISKRLGPIEQDRFTCTINRGSLWAVRGVHLICSAEIISNGNLEKSGLFAQVWKFVATSKWNKPTAQVASVTCMKFMTSSIATTTWNSTIAQVLQVASIKFMASYIAETIRNTIDVPTFPRQVVQSESYVISNTSAWKFQTIVTRIALNTPISRHPVVHTCTWFEKFSRLMPAAFKRDIVSHTMVRRLRGSCPECLSAARQQLELNPSHK